MSDHYVVSGGPHDGATVPATIRSIGMPACVWMFRDSLAIYVLRGTTPQFEGRVPSDGEVGDCPIWTFARKRLDDTVFHVHRMMPICTDDEYRRMMAGNTPPEFIEGAIDLRARLLAPIQEFKP